jgi:hypothetical protein
MNHASMPFDDDIVRLAKQPNLATLMTLRADGQPQARRRLSARTTVRSSVRWPVW